MTPNDVYPTAEEVRLILLEAVRECVGNNMLRPMRNILDPVLDDATLFDDSIIFRHIGMDGSLDLFKGRIPVQQFLGRVLYNEDVMKAFLGDVKNPLVNSHSMINTRVSYNPEITHLGETCIVVDHIMPYSDSLERYISRSGAAFTASDDGMATVRWAVPFEPDNMSGLMNAASSLGAVLNIYYKLLTRFPSCQSYQKALPGFRTS